MKFLQNLKHPLHNLLRISCLLFGLLSAGMSMAQVQPDTINNVPEPQDVATDTLQAPADTAIAAEPQGDIKTYINYSARDSIRFNVEDKIFYLFGDSRIEYGEITLEAERIDVNWNTNIITATGVLGEDGRIIGRPQFSEGEDRYVADTIQYNLKTRKGLIKNVVTQQGEGYVTGETGFKDENNNFYFTEAKYTTCNLAHPHFYIKANKLKVIPEDKVVSGPFNLYVADVPTPLGFFFGFFPIPKQKQSGFIMPTFGEDNARGFYLSQGGYYFSIKDYVGIQLLGDIYTNGTWRTSLGTTYRKRYSFNGNFNINYGSVREGFDEDTLPSNRLFNVLWTHTSAGKRNSRFSANVNASSNNYYKSISYNPTSIITGTFQSNIQYFKQFGNSPFSLTATLRQNQNVQTRISQFTIPDINFAMNRIYPFKSKTSSANRWYNNINVAYNFSTQLVLSNAPVTTPRATEITDPDSILPINLQTIDQLFERARYGAVHRIPISTTIKPRKTFLRHFNFNPAFDYTEFWYPERLTALGDTLEAAELGFFRASAYSFSTNATTWIYGTITGDRTPWLRKTGFRGLRHAINPTISYIWSPDFTDTSRFDNFFTLIDPNTSQVSSVSRYGSNIYGGPTGAAQSALTFGLSNSLEMKALTSDTTNPVKKFAILDRFGFNGGYNFAAEEFNLSNIQLYANTRILGIFDIRYNGSLDPYEYKLDSITQSGKEPNVTTRYHQTRLNQFAISEGQGLGTLVNSNFSIGLNLNPAAFRRKVIPPSAVNSPELEHINNNPNLYVDFTIPWNLHLNYVVNITRIGFAPPQVVQSLTAGGNISLTQNWKITFTSGYDIVNSQLTPTSVSIIRDLHCWQMSATVIPFGTRQSYFFTLNPKSTLLQDLKLTKRNSTYFGQPVF